MAKVYVIGVGMTKVSNNKSKFQNLPQNIGCKLGYF